MENEDEFKRTAIKLITVIFKNTQKYDEVDIIQARWLFRVINSLTKNWLENNKDS